MKNQLLRDNLREGVGWEEETQEEHRSLPGPVLAAGDRLIAAFSFSSLNTKVSSSTSCSLHPEPWEEIAQNAMGTGMGGGAAKSIWDSLQKEKQGPSLPRQESRRSLQKQGSRKEVTEPFKDRTNWKDSLRDKNKNQQGTTDDHEAKKYEARRSMSTRR